jgi:hypothetical protein
MAQERTLQTSVVRRALEACRRVDAQSRVVSMTTDAITGLTHLRVRAGDVHTVNGLQQALWGAMPFSTARVTENWIDGTLEADVTVLTAPQERLAARHAVARTRATAYWLLLAWAFIFLGMGEWSASVRGTLLGKDEL